jgi:hypothetical protein
MRRIVTAFVWVALGSATLAGCGSRKVDTTNPPPPAGPTYSLTVANNLTKAINVYVTAGGVDTFLRQVAASSTETVPVKGVPANTAVTLKATTVDGANTYSKPNVVLSNGFSWQVP